MYEYILATVLLEKTKTFAVVEPLTLGIYLNDSLRYLLLMQLSLKKIHLWNVLLQLVQKRMANSLFLIHLLEFVLLDHYLSVS